MDPNECLKALLAVLSGDPTVGDKEDLQGRLFDAKNAAEGLDSWMKGGGFLPDRWVQDPHPKGWKAVGIHRVSVEKDDRR